MSKYTFKKGNDCVITGTVTSGGSAYDITDHSFQFHLLVGNTKLLSQTGVITNAAGGIFTITLTDTQLNIKPSRYDFFIDMTDGSGNITTIDGGTFELLSKSDSLSSNDNSATVTVDTASSVELSVTLDVTNISGSGGSSTFIDLSDTPGNYVGSANFFVKVNADADGLEFIESGGNIATLADIGDVTITDNTSGEILKWNGSAWVNNTLAEAGIATSAQDAVGSILTDSSEIDFTYDDVTPSITASLIAGSIDETKLDTSVNASLDLADSALQSGDNISELTNDAGYITATLTNEQVQDIVGNMLTGNTETLITVTYQDIDGTIDFVVDNNLANYDNTTSGFITASSTSTLTNKSGNISQWTNDSGYITATLTNEQVQDIVGGMVSGNTETLITVTYQDSDGTIDFVVDNDLANYSNATSAFIDTAGSGLAKSGTTLNVDISPLTDVGTPASGDLLLVEDVTDGSIKKLQVGNLPTGGGGEANTASNLGVGVGVFEQKSGIDLQFNSLVSQNNLLTIAEDDANNEIDFTVNQSNISITASQVSDFDTEVSNNTDVAANTTARHDALTVTDSSEIDFTLTGQDLTASLITGSIDVLKLDSGVQTSLGLADSSLQSGDNISELTNNSGFITASSTSTLTNKTFDANGTGNSLSNVEVADLAAGAVVTESEGIASNDNDTTLPTSAAVKDYVDNEQTEVIGYAVSDESTALTTGTAKITFRMPFAMTLTSVRASVTTAPTDATLTVDINESGTTILSTKLTIDSTEKTSTTAATPPVISDSALADDAEMTIDIDQVGSTVAGAGLKIWLIGRRA